LKQSILLNPNNLIIHPDSYSYRDKKQVKNENIN